MNNDIELSSAFDSLLNGLNQPRKSSDILNENLASVRRVAEETERQRQKSATVGDELRNRLNTLRKAPTTPEADDIRGRGVSPHIQFDDSSGYSLGTNSSPAANRNLINNMDAPEIMDGDADPLAKELELQAKLQAERQQASLMRKALEERDRALKELEDQCQTLQDDLEDRDREVDHLTRKIEQVKEDVVVGSKPSEKDVIPERKSYTLNTMPSADHALDISELFKTTPDHVDKKTSLTRTWFSTILWIMIASGLVVTLGVLYGPQWFNTLSTLSKTVAVVPTVTAPAITTPTAVIPDTTQVQPNIETPATSVSEPAIAIVDYVIPPPLSDKLRRGGTGPKLIKLPPGKFNMGNKLAFTAAEQEERPVHEVTIKSFYMASHETTFAEYDLFASATGRSLPHDAGFGRGDRPVVNVSWDDAQAYVTWLSDETGYKYYLPSEAQWEYAARANTYGKYWWGNDNQPDRAICFLCKSSQEGRNTTTAPVGSLKPNAFGLYDTAGNVMEWLQDCYNRDYKGAPEDDSPWLTGDCSQRMVRGGAFNRPLPSLRSSARSKMAAKERFNMLGFRVARD